MELLDDTDEKYWSEIKEIIAYMMWKLYLKKEEERRFKWDKKMDIEWKPEYVWYPSLDIKPVFPEPDYLEEAEDAGLL